MQEYNIRLDTKLVQLKVAYAQEKKQKAKLEEQRRIAIKASLKEKVVVEEQRAKAKTEME